MIYRSYFAGKVDKWLQKGQIIVLTGCRRTGKSFVMKEFIERHGDDENSNIIYIDKEKKTFDFITNYQELNDYIDFRWITSKHNYILIDEIQDIEQWERSLRSYRTEKNTDIIITGSNSKVLSSELSTIIGGRYQEIKVQTLSYTEFLLFHQLPDSDTSLYKYLEFGGLPGLNLIGLENEDMIQDYTQVVYNTIVLKDIVEKYNIRNIPFLYNLLRFYADNISKINSANNISKYLKSQNEDVSVKAIQTYTSYYEAAYLLYSVRRYDLHGKRLLESNEKIYFGDMGIRNFLVRAERTKDFEKIIENVVFLHLIRLGFDVFVGVFRKGEIDFVCTKGYEKVYVQVSYIIASEETYLREFGTLREIQDNYPKYVISMTPGFEKTIENGIIHLSLRNFLTNGL